MLSEFVFQLLDRVGPVDRFGRLVVIADELHESRFQSLRAGKVIGLQMFALQQAKPDFDLIQPRGVGWQPEHLEVEVPVTGLFLLMEPAFELFGGVRGSIIEDEGHRVHVTTYRFRKDLLLHEGLEIGKAFALPTGPINLPLSDREPGKQMAGPAPMGASFGEQRLARPCWARRLFSLACLDRGFLIQTDQPSACS
jgi:hypothetical protein